MKAYIVNDFSVLGKGLLQKSSMFVETTDTLFPETHKLENLSNARADRMSWTVTNQACSMLRFFD